MAAEVTGLNLSHPLDAALRDRIYAAFLKYRLLVFRCQKLTKQQQVTFTEQFGPLSGIPLEIVGLTISRWSTLSVTSVTMVSL